MKKEIMLQQLEQSRNDCLRILDKISLENVHFRLTEKTASVGFIFRHIGETTNLIAHFFGYKTDIEGTTIGQVDSGNEYDLTTSSNLFEKGYQTLVELVKVTTENGWLEEIETSWFGKISRIKLYTILLLHNAHHCGQIASTIVKGKRF
ncbi:DinB family protein [Niastella caeni]|uniref:DinB family protein n=1 Tax=Niastella caeni TaxID=2569763 RepID=A0A4V4H1H9_9BACT|nr:DinB family protein [Niastella caeni]THU40546.1 DinB family protein [Niastella caeni]